MHAVLTGATRGRSSGAGGGIGGGAESRQTARLRLINKLSILVGRTYVCETCKSERGKYRIGQKQSTLIPI